jgi:hypothetical protein
MIGPKNFEKKINLLYMLEVSLKNVQTCTYLILNNTRYFIYVYKYRPTGDTFEVSPKNVQTSLWPAKGDIVTFKYETNSQKSKLNKAIVTQIREDLVWKDVAVASLSQQAPFSAGGTNFYLRRRRRAKRGKGKKRKLRKARTSGIR